MKVPSLFRFFTPKTTAVFISASESCPCTYMLELARNVPSMRCIQLTDLNSEETVEQLSRIANARKVLVFAHGSGYPLNCYYLQAELNRVRKIDIPNRWWPETFGPRQLVYFHVCHGSEIIRHSDMVNNTFNRWVSYNHLVDSVQTSIGRIRSMQQTFLKALSRSVRKRSNAQSLRSSVEAAYKEMESDLHEQGKLAPGHTAMVQMVGKNVHLLEHSHNN